MIKKYKQHIDNRKARISKMVSMLQSILLKINSIRKFSLLRWRDKWYKWLEKINYL